MNVQEPTAEEVAVIARFGENVRTMTIRMGPVAVLFTLLACSALPMSERGAGNSDLRLEYIPVGFELPKADRLKIRKAAEHMFRFYRRAGFRPGAFKLRIRIYPTLALFQRNYPRTDLRTKKGYYSRLKKEVVVNGQRPRSQLLETIYHEISHAFMGAFIPRVPNWVNEGMAEYFERIQVRPEGISIETQPWRFRVLQRHHAAGTLMSLSRSVRIPNRRWLRLNATGDQQVGCIAWSFLYFLMRNDASRGHIRDVLGYLGRNRTLPNVIILRYMMDSRPVVVERAWTAWFLAQ